MSNIPRLSPSLLESINELTSELYNDFEQARIGRPPNGNLAMILSRFCQEIIMASSQAAHEDRDT